jgi:hypothetical protein
MRHIVIRIVPQRVIADHVDQHVRNHRRGANRHEQEGHMQRRSDEARAQRQHR